MVQVSIKSGWTMALKILLLLFLFVLLSHEADSQPSPTRQSYICNRTVATLREMLELAEINNEASSIPGTVQYLSKDDVVCVSLQSEYTITEYLNYTATRIPFSVVISASSPVMRATVSCRNKQLQLPLRNYTVFPLVFSNSSLVSIENVDFIDCMRPVQLKWIKKVELVDSTFRNFYPGGAVEISNSPLILIDGCQFTNNTSQGLGMDRFSGNSGGIAVGYDDSDRPAYFRSITPEILVRRSTFSENSALADSQFVYGVSYVLSERLYNQRGGAMAVYIGTPDYSALLVIEECTFKRNNAQDSGGAVYMYLSGEDSTHNIWITETMFVENEGPDGGGLEITQFTDTITSLEKPYLVYIANCHFLRNKGRFGGGYKSIQIATYLNNVTVVNSTFIGNQALVGSALYFQSIYSVSNVTKLKRSIVQDCTFLDNSAHRGTFFVILNTVGILGETVFKGNTGPALRILNSLVSFGGNISFIGNKAHPEGFSGALYFSQFGQVVLERNTTVYFINNTGEEGACIVVKGQLIAAGFLQQLYNPQCFLQYEDPRVPTQLWNVSMLFEGNSARVGPVVLTSGLDPCQWYNEVRPFFSQNSSVIWQFMDMRDNYILREPGVSRKLPNYYVQTGIYSLLVSENDTTVRASPGSTIEIEVIALDQQKHNTSAFLEIVQISTNQDTSDIVFEPNIVQTIAGSGKIQFSYMTSDLTGNTTVQLKASFNTEEVEDMNLTLIHESCLPGYSLRDKKCECEEGSKNTLFCYPDKKGILLAEDLWGAPPNWSQKLVTVTCPAGYCDCGGSGRDEEREGCYLSYEEPYRICDNNRTGLLCGRCNDTYGVGMLTNICRPYFDLIPQFYWLLPIYLIALVVVLIVIVRIGFHFPTSLRGFLFYTQLASIAVAYLPSSFSLRTDVMDCIWSATALYVPYDFSFHKSMTSLESYGLRYSTLVVAIVVVPITARVGRSHSKYWHGVWTIILVLYARAVDTSISILYCKTLVRTSPSGITEALTIWFFDGNVSCFQGAHLFLAIVALVVLALLALLVPLAAVVVYYKKFKRKFPSIDRLEGLSIALRRGFKEKYKWWSMMELGCRFIFIVTVQLCAGFGFVPLVLSLILLVTQTVAHPYKNKLANHLETFSLLVLVVLLALGNTTPIIIGTNMDNLRDVFTLWPLFFLPVAVGAIVAVIYFGYQIWKWFQPHKHSLKKRFRKHSPNIHRKPTRLEKFGMSLRSNRAALYKATSVTSSIVGFDDDPVDAGVQDDEYIQTAFTDLSILADPDCDDLQS